MHAIHSSHGGLPQVQGGPVNYLLLQGMLMFPEPPACSSNTVEKAKTRERQAPYICASQESSIQLLITNEGHTGDCDCGPTKWKKCYEKEDLQIGLNNLNCN